MKFWDRQSDTLSYAMGLRVQQSMMISIRVHSAYTVNVNHLTVGKILLYTGVAIHTSGVIYRLFA